MSHCPARLPLLLLTLVTVACDGGAPPCARCDTLVIAALGEPDHLLPPLVWQSVGRDIDDLVFERLAQLDPLAPPTDPAAYRPALASSWERVDSLTWRFRLRPGARWHDGRPVTADDVVFSFAAHQDSVLDAVARGSIADVAVTAEDSATVRMVFATSRPDQLYDAIWHVRVFPRHLWDSIPPAQWGERTDIERLTGSGPYRVTAWVRGQSLTLEATTDTMPLRRVVWRFADAPDAAGNLALAREADLLETIPEPARRPEFESAPHLRLVPYPSAVYGFLGFNLAGTTDWSDVRVRRALRMTLDRETLARAVFGPETQVPPGPISGQVWLWDSVPVPPADSAGAAALLDSAGWVRSGTGRRQRTGRPLAIDILVPSTSGTRRSMAVALQERWARLGVQATVTAVDFPVFQERLRTGRFETYIGAWLDEPHPRSLADQWTRAGWQGLNYGRYDNPAFDALFTAAMRESDPVRVRPLWREALDTLNADVPGIWLYTLSNVAVVDRRLDMTRFRPFAWLADVGSWRLRPPAAAP